MNNVSYEITNGRLVITVDVSADAARLAPLSTTGKTRLLASTHGTAQLPPLDGKPLSFSLNVMVKP